MDRGQKQRKARNSIVMIQEMEEGRKEANEIRAQITKLKEERSGLFYFIFHTI